MYNLLMKELKLGVSPIFYILPFLTGLLMLIPAWLYFLVPLYFCFITIPNMFAGYKSQNDLQYTSILPVTKKDIVKAKMAVIILLELLHIVIAAIIGIINLRLYPNLTYYFFGPYMGFWGLCFVMLAIFNILFISMYYKTAYKYGVPSIVAITAAILFAGATEWLGIQNEAIYDLFKGTGTDNLTMQLLLLIAGIFVFVIFNIIAYRIAIKRFQKVEV